MPVRVGGIINKRSANSVQIQGIIDASLASNLPVGPLVGDRYRVTVAGSFEDSASIVPFQSFFSVGDQIEFNSGGVWTKIEAGDNILDVPFGAGWNNDQDNTASRNVLYDKFELERTTREGADATLQTNIDGKSDLGHTHTLSEITDSGTSAGLDVAPAGNASAGQVVKGDDSRLSDNRDPNAHSHGIADTTGLQSALDGKTDTGHGHTLADISDSGTSAGLNVASSGDAGPTEVVKGDDSRLSNSRPPSAHTHNIADVNNLATELAGKAPVVHTHVSADITDAGDIITRDASEFASNTDLGIETTNRINADNALSDRIEEVATEKQFFGEKVNLRDRPGIEFPLNASTLSSTPSANPTTYPGKTAIGQDSQSINLQATQTINAYASEQVFTFSGANNGATWFGLMRVPGVPIASQPKIIKVEVSDNGSDWKEADSEEYFDRYFQDQKDAWMDDEFLRYPVNKRNQAHVRITVDAVGGASFSTKQGRFFGYAGQGNLEGYVLSPIFGGEDLDPFSFQSDNGDRWLYITTSAGSYGAGSDLVHESNLRDFAVLNDITSASVFVDGGNFDGSIGTYAKNLLMTPTEMVTRAGEAVDLIGTWTYNGVEIGTGGGAVSDEAFGVSWDGDTTQGASRNALYDKLTQLENTLNTLLAGALLDDQGSIITDDTGDIITGVDP